MSDLTPNFSKKDFFCLICKGSTICSKCDSRYYKSLSLFYKEQLDFILNISSEKLQLSIYDRHDIDDYFFIYSTYPEYAEKFFIDLIEQDKSILPYFHFITITFDPSKFGVSNPKEDEEYYILDSIMKCCKKHYITKILGCFEQHKSGVTHAHFVCITRDNSYKDYLKRRFTDNPRNNNAVKPLPGRYPAVFKYLKKESTKFFVSFEESNPLDI